MKPRPLALLLAAPLALAACGGTMNDPADVNQTAAPSDEGLGENMTMMNDMTTANDVAIGNEM